MAEGRQTELVVVGGGIIGLAVAWRARQAGISVCLLERGIPGEGTSRVAAGMLAPVAEVEFGAAGQSMLQLGLRSAAMWPSFAEELAEVSGLEIPLRRTGTLLVARDEDEALELERQLEFRRSIGLAVERLRPSEAREREPALAPTLRLALEAPDDHAVDPRPVLGALRLACAAAGVEIREQTPVAGVALERGRVTGVRLAGGELLEVPAVVLACGPWTAGLEGLGGALVPVRPVKGQILRLRDPLGPGMLGRVIRFEGGYVVPRGDGRYVLGATVEERGFELQATAGGVYELLRDAHALLPGIAELEIEELSAGLRPGTPDNLPAIGPGAAEGLIWATGHHRNGILLAPLTADLILGVLAGEPAALAPACDPARFAAAEVPA
jgi:glycine oxidase